MRPEDLTEDKVFEILTWLAAGDAKFAEAKADLENAEILQRRVRAKQFLASDEETVTERKEDAEVAEETQAADDAYIAARLAFEKLKASRESGIRWYDLYRTMSATRRAGIIT